MSVPAANPDYRVALEMFEGPLDLLLHLVRTQEIDIQDIPIARITEQYLSYLQLMKDLNITVAGEYLVMAATLIHIKSRLLLPQPPAGAPEEEDPRKELTEQLVEYDRFKTAAHLLYENETVELSVWARGRSEFEEPGEEALAVNAFDLIQAFHRIVERYKDQMVHPIEPEKVTLESQLFEIRSLLKVQKECLFSSFFKGGLSRLHLVLTLLALLELTRLGEVQIFQKRLFEDIRILAC